MSTFSVADTLSLREALQLASPGAVDLLVDVLNFTDVVSAPTLGFGVSATDTIALLDAAVDNIKYAIPIPLPDAAGPDRIVLMDSVEVSLDFGKLQLLVFDVLNFNDSRSSSNTNSPAVADTIALSDLPGVGRATIFPDSIALLDAATNSLGSIFLNLSATGSDTLVLSDTLQLAGRGSFTVLSDTLQLSDLVGVSFHSNFTPYLRRYLNDV